jgi:hypothetical protein
MAPWLDSKSNITFVSRANTVRFCMPQSPLFFRFVAILLPLAILAAMPRQADAADDPTYASFDERWQSMPGYDNFICGFKPDARLSLSKENEIFPDPKPEFLWGLRQQLRDVQNALLSRYLAKARKKRGTVRIEDPVDGIFGTLPEPYAKPCIIGWDQCVDK